MANESIEWSNVWREQADTHKRRVLLIGDSLTWQAKGFVSANLPQELAMSVYATSKGVDDPFLLSELELLIQQDNADYAAVYVNNGLHAHGQTPKQYEQNYEATLKRLRALLPRTRFLIGLCTPVSLKPHNGKDSHTPINEQFTDVQQKNLLVIQYNQRVRCLADELSIPYLDAYALLVDHDELKADCYHYTEEGRRLLGQAIAKAITDILTND